MPISSRAYILRETQVAAIVNAVLSVAVFLAVFGRRGPGIPVWGIGELAFDFAVQSFCVAFMSTLVPGLVAAAALRGNKVAACPARPDRLPRGLLLRTLAASVIATAGGGGLCAILLFASGATQMDWLAVLAIKALYGGGLGAIIVAWTLPLALIKS